MPHRLVFRTDFDLRTQQSHDWEAGVRLQYGAFKIQSTYYDMRADGRAPFQSGDLHQHQSRSHTPPRRRDNCKLAGDLGCHTARQSHLHRREVHRRRVRRQRGADGVPLDRKHGPVVEHLWPAAWLDANLRYFSQRYLDGNENNANAVYFVPTTTLVDLKIGGEMENFFWSAAVQNVFDREFYDYGLDISSPGFPFYSFYTQPGRTFMVKTGTNW